METTSIAILASWAVLLFGFVGIAAFLYWQEELTYTVVAIYWFPSLVLTLVGVFQPPWAALS